MEKAKMSEENQKMRYKYEKIAKIVPTWANLRLQNQKEEHPRRDGEPPLSTP